MSTVASLAVLYFTTIIRNVIENKMRVLVFSTALSEIFLILGIIQRNIIKNVHTASYKIPVILAAI
jgi:hypothetical protein